MGKKKGGTNPIKKKRINNKLWITMTTNYYQLLEVWALVWASSKMELIFYFVTLKNFNLVVFP